MKLSGQLSFNELCRNEVKGFSYEEKTLIRPKDPANYDEVVFKIITKCDTNILLLETHKGEIDSFSIEVIALDPPDSCNRGTWGFNYWEKENGNTSKKSRKTYDNSTIIEAAWQDLEETYNGLLTIAVLGPLSMPDNEGRQRYTLGQFVEHIIGTIESYYMFHKPKSSFNPSVFKGEQFSIQEDTRTYKEGYAVVMLWKCKEKRSLYTLPEANVNMSPVSPVVEKRVSSVVEKRVLSVVENRTSAVEVEVSPVKNKTLNITISELDTTATSTTPVKKNEKLSRRKSMIGGDWSDEEKSSILDVFDNLNPDITETTQIALCCKYASLQYNKELPSKILYSWIQKKGRVSIRTVDNFDLDTLQGKQMAVEFYRTLNEEQTEGSRVAFVIKYFKSQFNITFTSKELITWLTEKQKKAAPKSSRGRKRKTLG